MSPLKLVEELRNFYAWLSKHMLFGVPVVWAVGAGLTTMQPDEPIFLEACWALSYVALVLAMKWGFYTALHKWMSPRK